MSLSYLIHYFSGLGKLASNGVEVSGIRLLYSSRHILAIVCGLGMGIMSALFLLVNIIADSSHDGVVGLPSTIPQVNVQVKEEMKGHQKDCELFRYPTKWR
jgi:hypothetical protein